MGSNFRRLSGLVTTYADQWKVTGENALIARIHLRLVMGTTMIKQVVGVNQNDWDTGGCTGGNAYIFLY